MWRSLVARFVRDEEAAGSNPVTPTKFDQVNALARMSQPFSQCDLTVSGSGDVRFWEQPTSHLFTVELPARVRAYAVTPRPGTRPASRPHASLASALAEWDSGGPFYGGRKTRCPRALRCSLHPPDVGLMSRPAAQALPWTRDVAARNAAKPSATWASYRAAEAASAALSPQVWVTVVRLP